jgi:lipid A 3-O-deacylase
MDLRVLVFALAVALPAAAEERLGTLTAMIENDRVANTDRHYTHGTRIAWISPVGNVPAWGDSVIEAVPLFDRDGARRIGYGAGQLIFTPADIARASLNAEDRPYAGWLYGTVSLHSSGRTRRDSIELALGVVGPGAAAEQVQTVVHEIIGSTRPMGWRHQVGNEPGLALTFERQWRLRKPLPLGGLGFDVIPTMGASLGNVRTMAAAGATFRLGQNLPQDFGPPRIRPSLPGSQTFDSEHGWGWYAFAGAEVRYMARSIFFDGNTFGRSHRVKKRRLVGDFQLGLALLFDSFRLTYTHVFRTREYDGQPSGDRFGAISLSWRY